MTIAQSGRGSDRTGRAGGGARRTWLLIAVAVLVVGLVLSTIGALRWSSEQLAGEREAFHSTADDVTATLASRLRSDADFVSTLRATLTMEPHISPSRYVAWYSTLNTPDRDVGGQGSLVVARVPAAQLSVFERRRNADPAFRTLIRGWLAPVPRGHEQTYCVLAGGNFAQMTGAVAKAIQGDWCRANSAIGLTQSRLIREQTDTGQIVALPIDESWLRTLLVETAFYRRGAPLGTLAERRAAVAGWLLTSFDMPDIIRGAIGRNPTLSVDVYHTNPGGFSMLVGSVRSSRAARLGQTTMLGIDGTWAVHVGGLPMATGLSSGTEGLLVFITGALLSLLLATLLLVLSRSRSQALALVAKQTGQLRHQALHDALTGLPNRTLALDRADQMLARARRTQVPIAALYVDIDGFKHVNDTFGHAAGDAFLKLVAARLQSVVRESDTAARLAGDEFVVLVEGAPLDAGPQHIAERLLEVLREPYDLNGRVGRQLSVSASIGVAYGLRDTAEQLLADADIALYAAKSAGKNRYVLFQSGMQTAAQDRLTLELDLADAFERGQLFLLYQPILELQSERLVGVEALLRWRHPTRGIVPPAVFVPVAEDSGMIAQIGRWVLIEACRQTAAWHRQGIKLGVSVNVSARQFDRDELLDDVRHALERSRLDPSALTVEITETTLMRDADATAARVRALKDGGVRVAIDDFGTGYSSLAYVRRFPVDALKIDRYFIKGVAASKESTAMIQTLVRLGQTLKLTTIAEGIEDRTQLSALQREGCDQGQGFLFGTPIDSQGVESLMRQGPGQRAA
jgi:diguanylate cyclase (GGDEF)-like protein